jgi:hypothetical protein
MSGAGSTSVICELDDRESRRKRHSQRVRLLTKRYRNRLRFESGGDAPPDFCHGWKRGRDRRSLRNDGLHWFERVKLAEWNVPILHTTTITTSTQSTISSITATRLQNLPLSIVCTGTLNH